MVPSSHNMSPGNCPPESTTRDPLDAVFAHLDTWRHLPAYQLERRADIFFSAYLPEVVGEYSGIRLLPSMVPELPLKRDLIWPDKPTNKSVKVDYCLLAEDRSKAIMVELKTDAGSRREAQDTYLRRAPEIGFRRIVEGIVEIARATAAHQKYGHLLRLLAAHGCLHLPDAYADHVWPATRPGLGEQLRQIEVTVAEDEFAIEVVYVQPIGDGRNCIDFESFASHVERKDDPISMLFAQSLQRWTEAAGALTAAPRSM